MTDPRSPDSSDLPADNNPDSPDTPPASTKAGDETGAQVGGTPERSTPGDPSPGGPATPEQQTAASRPGGQPARQPSPRRSPWAGIAAVLSLIAIAGVVWLWQSREGMYRDLAQQQRQLEESLQQQGGTVDELRAAFDREMASGRNLKQSVEQQLAQVQAEVQREFVQAEERQRQEVRLLNERLDDHQRRLTALSASNREHWLLAEAAYLLRLANQRVLIEGAPDNAANLLQSADDLVRQAAEESGSAELRSIRRSLAADITALEMVEAVDRDGLYVRLQGLADNLENLSASAEARFESAATREESPSAASSDMSWAEKAWAELKSMVGAVDQYFRIQDSQTPAEPLADQAALRLVRLQVGLLLEQAQVAVLKGDERVYQESLERAGALLSDYYQSSDELERFRASLDELRQIDIAPDLPDISESLQKLMTYIQNAERRGGTVGAMP